MDANSVVEPVVESVHEHLNTNRFETEHLGLTEIMTAFAPMEVGTVFEPAEASFDVELVTHSRGNSAQEQTEEKAFQVKGDPSSKGIVESSDFRRNNRGGYGGRGHGRGRGGGRSESDERQNWNPILNLFTLCVYFTKCIALHVLACKIIISAYKLF
ncbi:hypothetical protein Tco_0918121 [Tanacetum coccineum]